MTAPGLTVAAVDEAVGWIEHFPHNSHGVAFALVRSGLAPAFP
jgi:hypothetical protein